MLDDKCPSESFCPFGFLEEFRVKADKDFPDLFLLLRSKLQHFRQVFDRPVGARRLPERFEPARVAAADDDTDEAPGGKGQAERQQALEAGPHQKNTSYPARADCAYSARAVPGSPACQKSINAQRIMTAFANARGRKR